jgi:hypothetical protein
VALASIGPAAPAHGQDLEPRSYVNTPVGMNFVLAGYAYTEGDVVFSPTTPVEDAEIKTHAGVLAYVRTLDLWGLAGKAAVIVPVADVSGKARANGVPQDRDVFGFADPTFRLSANFYGAPALSMEEFKGYEQDLILGATLNVSPPLGQYDSSKLLNIGTNRWTIKPELGASQAFGPLTLEVSAAASVFTDNDDFFNGQRLEQEPLYSVQGHVVYELRSGPWAALDATYYRGGLAITDGKEGEELENARLGLTLAIPVNRYNSIKLFGSFGVYTRAGSDYQTVGIAWQVRWGGGP